MGTVRKLYSAEDIARRVDALAGEIAGAVSGDLTIVGILKGSFVFVADLARALDRAGLAPRIEFVRLSSYGQAKESSGEVRLIGDVPMDLGGRQVLLVDDIVDSAGTLCNAAKALTDAGASGVTAYVTHGVLSGGAVARVASSPLDRLVITDSIMATEAVRTARNIEQLSIAPLMAEAIRRISEESSVSSLFD